MREVIDGCRFYRINGRLLPSVTSAISAISKPALDGWMIREERKAFERVLVSSTAYGDNRDDFMALVMGEIAGPPASKKIAQAAADFGTAVHNFVEWDQLRMLGQAVGVPRPRLPAEAGWAVEGWENWVRDVEYRPIAVETTVACEACGYAGALDWVGYVKDKRTLGDIKTSRAIYMESFIQNVAYRHAAPPELATEQGLILRLPKNAWSAGQRLYESKVVPAAITLDDFLAALRLWRLQRAGDGKEVGSRAAGGHGARVCAAEITQR